jgi:hypothetical protein
MVDGNMHGKLLSEAEWKYLAGEFKPGEVYERKLRFKITKKAERFIDAMPDFALILRSGKLSERILGKLLSWHNYQLKILPMAQALYLSLFSRIERDEDSIQALQDTLEAAGIPYQPKRLRLDKDYALEKRMATAKWIREHQPEWMRMETEDPSARAHIGLLIDEDVWRKFKEAVEQNFLGLRQGINKALEEWASRNTRKISKP